jgi:hypothetical protein
MDISEERKPPSSEVKSKPNKKPAYSRSKQSRNEINKSWTRIIPLITYSAQQWMLHIYIHHAWVGLTMDHWLGDFVMSMIILGLSAAYSIIL